MAQKSTGQSSATTLASNSSSGSNNVSASTKTEAKTITSYYKVRKGDTWAGIAKKNGATVAQIKKWNNIKSNKLIAGTSLKIQKTQYIQVQAEEMTQNKLSEPVLPTVEIDSTFTAALFDTYLKKVETERNESTLPRVHISSTDDENDHSTNDSRIIYHKVKIGETISQIANRYNVSKKDIQSWNKLSGNMAKVGQRLLIILPEGSDTLNSNSEQADRGTPYTADK
ncbi:LysM peptidoglycan-binding domain-containing protein [Dysgonomonas sp. 521]|uniref:lytic transglycosylase n=1 Tax=Dysgonomonas sp. 521 TaxID=2302932 RepID=UPI00351B0E7B